MNKNNLRTCICCGKEYEYCPVCSKYDKYPSWMANFHNKNCREIFKTAIEYVSNNISDEEARARLDKCNLDEKENFETSVLEMIEKLYPSEIEIMPEPEIATDESTEVEENIKPITRKSKNRGGKSRQ